VILLGPRPRSPSGRSTVAGFSRSRVSSRTAVWRRREQRCILGRRSGGTPLDVGLDEHQGQIVGEHAHGCCGGRPDTGKPLQFSQASLGRRPDVGRDGLRRSVKGEGSPVVAQPLPNSEHVTEGAVQRLAIVGTRPGNSSYLRSTAAPASAEASLRDQDRVRIARRRHGRSLPGLESAPGSYAGSLEIGDGRKRGSGTGSNLLPKPESNVHALP